TTLGGTSNTQNFTVNLAPPPAPTNLTATAVAASQINLAWSVNSVNETGFKIERKTGGGTYSQLALAAAQANKYVDTGLTAGTTYYYRVRATNGAGDSLFTNEFNATRASAAPATPTGLGATAVSTTQINLSWTLNLTGVVGIKLERMPAGGSFAQVAVLCPVTSYSDTGLTQNATYTYRIRPYNSAGDGAYSTTVT